MKKRYSHAMRKYLFTAVISAVLMITFALLMAFGDFNKYILAASEAAIAIFAVSYVVILARSRKKAIIKYLQNITRTFLRML